MCVVQNGVDLARVDSSTASSHQRTPESDAFTVVAVSRLVDVKNPSSVIAAFRMSADACSRLVYIGDGILRSSICAKIRRAGLEDRVTLTGLVPRDQVFEHLLGADLFVSASRGEGLPVSVLEAMACCCPVVLSNIPPHREIAEGVDFIPLVQPDDVAGLAQEISRIKAMPASARASLGQRCRTHVEEHFSLAAMHAEYERVYAQAMRAKAGSRIDNAL